MMSDTLPFDCSSWFLPKSLFTSGIFLLFGEIFISTRSRGTASIVAIGLDGGFRLFASRVRSLEFNCIFLN